jgi:hypothetical protein
MRSWPATCRSRHRKRNRPAAHREPDIDAKLLNQLRIDGSEREPQGGCRAGWLLPALAAVAISFAAIGAAARW